ncbi:MAG: hypothetical protein CVU39_13475 [Chloroflexi bacterium HGW-Chloroflexi-10]|nr:MAG: hypothetical protein CVU39_13475 [Chloroflexi bacterium HGW-Chloroflexi-10]
MTLTLTTERNLIERARDGDADAFESLIEAYTPQLYTVVRRLAQDEQQTEMVLQETFWRAWRALSRYQTDKPFLPYLVTIAANYQRDLWRKEHRNFDLDSLTYDIHDDQVSLQEQAENQQFLGELGEIIQKMPPAYRMVITLRYDTEFSYEQIAETLDMPINTVRTHLRRAKEWLRINMGDREWMNWNTT